MRTSWAALLLAGLLASGCGHRRGGGGDDDDDAQGDGDADADADGDADPPECTLGCPSGYECDVGVCGGGDPTDLVIDVPTVRVSGTVTMNGTRPATGSDCGGCPDCSKASVGFTSASGSSFSASVPCSSSPHAFSLDLPPDTYVVGVYGYGETYSALPSGTAIVDGAFEVAADAEGVVFDVPTVAVSGTLTMNGARPATGPDCGGCPDCSKASVSFTSASGASFSAAVPCSSSPHAFSLDLPPDTYVVGVYGYGETYSALPPGTAIADGSFVVDQDVAGVDFDIPTVSVSGTVTMNGARPATGSDCSGCPDCSKASVSFTSTSGASFGAAIPCASSPHAFALELPPDTYTVGVYGYGETYSALPPGTAVVETGFEVDADAAGVSFDVPTVAVSGVVTLNGTRPATGSDCGGCPDCSKASVSFAGESGSSFSASVPCSSSPHAFSLELPPDRYTVGVYGYGETYSALPSGTAVVDTGLEVDADADDLVFDVPTVAVGGVVTLNGARPATGTDCGGCPDCSKASVSFASESGSSFSASIPCSSSPHAFALELPPDRYTVGVYGYGPTYSALPPGTSARVRSLQIP